MARQCLLASLLLALPLLGQAAGYDSSYSSIEPHQCQTLSMDEETASSVQRCPGFQQFGVLAIDADGRQSLTLELGGRQFPLDFWSSVSGGFSELGKLVEWRHRRGQPSQVVGMIVRLNVQEGDSAPIISYLVVSKITPERVCVVAKVPPRQQQNEQARILAEQAAQMPCVGGW